MRRLALVIGLGGALFSGPAAADEPDHTDARTIAGLVAGEWKKVGADVQALPSRFVFDEESVLVALPVPAQSDSPSGCTEVAILAARGLSFRARLSDAPTDPLAPPEPNARAASAAGILSLRRCGTDGPPVRNVVVTAEAGRGAVEIVVGRSGKPLPPLASLVPERSGGAVPAPPEAGALPPLGTPDTRADAAEARAKREGATTGGRAKLKAGDDGSGEAEIPLEAGCHRVEVFGREVARERPGRRFRLDVDAELRDAEHVLARDRTEAPDARLETCVGTATSVTLAFVGSPPHGDVTVTRATWPLPEKLPSLWGPPTRAKMARALFVRHVAAPVDDPVYLAQGSTGATPIPLSTEVGGCYVAVVGTARGHARQLQLRTVIGARESTDERGAADEAALAAFCVRAHETAHVDVLARGTGVAWGFALYRVQSGDWEQGQ